MYNQFIRQYAADGVETAGAVDVEDPPQEEQQVEEDATPQEKPKTEDKQAEVEEEKPEDDELEIDGIEETEDGKIKYTLGNSVYISKEGLKGNKAVSDVLKQAREAATEKDKAFVEMKTKTSQQKAASAITLPKTLSDKDDDDEKLPEIPKLQAIVNHVFTQAGLDPKMAKWTDQEWIQYEDDNSLRPWQTSRIQESVKEAQKEVNNYDATYLRNYNNAVALRQSRDSVRDMVAGIDGVNADDFSAEFHDILKRGMKGEGLNEFKELMPAWVVKEFGKVIGKSLTARQKSKLETEVQKKVLESQEQRRKSKPAAVPGAVFKKTVKTPTSIAEASKMIMDEWKS